MPDDMLLKWRPEFPILQKCTYLISNSLGAMPQAAYTALKEYADAWSSRGVEAWSDSWWEMPVRMGDLVAPIIGANPGEVSFHPNVTIAEAIVLSCFDFRGPRRKIVLTDMDFPSVTYLCHAQKSEGAEICIVRSEDGIGVDLSRLLDAIDERTLLVPVSHVLFRTACVMDAEAIVTRARRRRLCRSRCVPVRGGGSRKRERMGRGFCDRRLLEMALRRAGGRLPLRAARAARDAVPALDRMDGASGPVRLPDRRYAISR